MTCLMSHRSPVGDSDETRWSCRQFIVNRPGGNTDVARSVIGHFLTEPQPYQVHEIPAVERATGVPRRFVEVALPRAPHYGGPVAVLGGRWTGSMGEGLVVGLDAAAGAVTVGSDMGDLLGALWNRGPPGLGGSGSTSAARRSTTSTGPRARRTRWTCRCPPSTVTAGAGTPRWQRRSGRWGS